LRVITNMLSALWNNKVLRVNNNDDIMLERILYKQVYIKSGDVIKWPKNY